jgi:uncharacterized protein (DUF2237 family)
VAKKNVLGTQLTLCCREPMTGFSRSGFCEMNPDDLGAHLVCAEITKEFLEFSLRVGNDLSTPHPELGFPGLKPGDKWCLCALRWKEALDAGMAPPVVLTATHEYALEYLSLEELKENASEPA